MKNRYCHICKKKVHSATHGKIHKDIIDLETYKFEFYLYNFPKLKDKQKLEDLYLNKKYSLPMLVDYVDGIDLKALCFVLSKYCIGIRSIKDALNLKETRIRCEQRCIQKYGKPNVLSKGALGYIKRNKTVKDRYGVDNVFQCIEDFMKEHGKLVQKRSKFSSLNKRIESILIANNISYHKEFRIRYFLEDKQEYRYKFYDFKIENTNLLIEVNGDYWHANPQKYQADTVFYFPKQALTAQEIWNIDKFKEYVANVNNYRILTIWEAELKRLSDNEIYQQIKNTINQKS